MRSSSRSNPDLFIKQLLAIVRFVKSPGAAERELSVQVRVGTELKFCTHRILSKGKGKKIMKKLTVVFVLMITLFGACVIKADNLIVGKWTIATRGVDKANNPCLFVPDAMEFFRDGTVAMSNVPGGMQMFYTTALNEEEARQAMAKFSYLKDRQHILLIGPSQADLINRAMAYDYSVAQYELVMAVPGWTPSTYSRVK